MNLEEKINIDIKTAMLAKEAAKLEALRAIKAEILKLKTSGEEFNEDSQIKALQRMVKQRKESAEIFFSQDRGDLAHSEIAQANIIEMYLPKQLSHEELTQELKEVIAETGASSQADFGKVMGAATKRLSGKADGKMISQIAKELLN
ncbi:MAG: GatB/YqeY domain-containing protein [Bacteroidetes bacterium]|nr:GatB/YqeY domain-containing protein [Bacteroidota bacterium]HET6245590.1 GatB/YqeY domain-containing protein [Bacteroidia bacterium]